MMPRTYCSDLADRVRRAARNGTRLHLDVQHVRVLMSDPIYSAIATAERKELNALCQQDNEPTNAPVRADTKSAPSGFGIAPIATTGISAGTREPPAEGVGHAASRLASGVAAQIARQKKRARH